MQGSSVAASRFVLTAVGHIQRLSACGTGFRKCGSFVRGWSGLHGLRHPLVCKWPITATSIQVLSRLAGRDRFPVTQHAGSGGFPARGRHFSGMPVTALSVSTVCHRNLVAYLRIPKTVDLGLAPQSMGLNK